MPDPGYFNRVNKNILEVIPPDAKTVLEIGCGAGALCEAYRRINPAVKWIAIEKNEEARKNAHAIGISLLGRDAEGDPIADDDGNVEPQWIEIAEMYRQQIDCLVLGDILEHLVDPWAVLKRHAGYLRPGAQVLASIPNVQHYTVQMHLMTGHWRYGDSGLLDRTHLRFFTLSSIRELFEDAGLQIFEIRGCVEGGDRWDEWLEIAKRIQLSTENIKESRCVQYLVRAIKPERWQDRYKDKEVAVLNDPNKAISPIDSKINRIEKLHIHAVIAEDCCARPRIREPLAMIGTVPGVSYSINDLRRKGDILIFQRDRNAGGHIPIRYKTALLDYSILIAEIDDLPEAIGVPPIALQAVHAIQCSTEALAEVCRQYNPHVFVFENQITELPPPPNKGKQPPTVTIFFGAQNREADWVPIMPALNRVLADHPQVCMMVIHDKAFFDALETPRKNFYEFCTYDRYRKILGGCDIALLPLEDTPFNRCKSDLKFLECAAEGVACLGSDIAIGHLWCRYPEGPQAACYVGRDGFESGLRALIEKPKLRCDAAQRAYTYVRHHRLLSQHYHHLHEWYLSLIQTKSILQRDLLARVPELAPRQEPSLQREDHPQPVLA